MAKSKKSLLRSSFICSSTLGLFISSPFVVYADDYEYIPISDVEQYNAYRYFSLYGYNLDYTNSISYTISESGTYNATYNGNLSTLFSGSESSSVNLHISNYTDAGALQNTIAYGGYIAYQPSTSGGIGSEIDITLDADLTNNPTSAAPFACRATSFSDQTGYPEDWEYNSFTCQTTGGAGYQMFPDYDVTVDAFNINNNGIGTFTIDLQNQGTSVGSFSGSLTGSNSGSLNGSISLSGTESTIGHKLYDIPIMNVDNLNNSYYHLKRIYARNDNPYIICFLSSTAGNNNGNFPIAYNSDDTLATDVNVKVNRIILSNSGYYFNCYEISGRNTNSLVYLKYQVKYADIIPIYVGMKNYMSDKLYRYIYGSDRTDTLIDFGTSESQAKNNANDAVTSEFSDTADQLHDIDDTWNNNMNTQLNSISVDSDMLIDNKFLATANWVRTQYERIVLNTPFETLLVFSLILGLALVLIGKVR